jgi:hypothetical protein
MSHALLGTVVPKTKESENAFSTGCQTSDNKINSSASLEESVINVGVVLVSVRKGSFSALGRWDRPPIWPLPSAVVQAGSRRSARRYVGTPPRNPSLRRAQGKLFPCQDEKCLLSERKPRGAWNLSRGFRMDTSRHSRVDEPQVAFDPIPLAPFY